MYPLFLSKSGHVPGRNHVLYGKNCQDALRFSSVDNRGDIFHVGLVCDGCSSGKYSEVGANLGAQYLLQRSFFYIQASIPVCLIPTLLHRDILYYLQSLIPNNRLEENVCFIQDHLLFTVVGYIMSPIDTVVFRAGDGLFVVNEHTFREDRQNEPDYLAYHLVDPAFLQSNRRPIPDDFSISTFATGEITRIAIGTDGWFENIHLLSEVWGKKHPMSLQRQMNVWSDRDHLFSDDASLIILEPVDPHKGG